MKIPGPRQDSNRRSQ